MYFHNTSSSKESSLKEKGITPPSTQASHTQRSNFITDSYLFKKAFTILNYRCECPTYNRNLNQKATKAAELPPSDIKKLFEHLHNEIQNKELMEPIKKQSQIVDDFDNSKKSKHRYVYKLLKVPSSSTSSSAKKQIVDKDSFTKHQLRKIRECVELVKRIKNCKNFEESSEGRCKVVKILSLIYKEASLEKNKDYIGLKMNRDQLMNECAELVQLIKNLEKSCGKSEICGKKIPLENDREIKGMIVKSEINGIVDSFQGNSVKNSFTKEQLEILEEYPEIVRNKNNIGKFQQGIRILVGGKFGVNNPQINKQLNNVERTWIKMPKVSFEKLKALRQITYPSLTNIKKQVICKWVHYVIKLERTYSKVGELLSDMSRQYRSSYSTGINLNHTESHNIVLETKYYLNEKDSNKRQSCPILKTKLSPILERRSKDNQILSLSETSIENDNQQRDQIDKDKDAETSHESDEQLTHELHRKTATDIISENKKKIKRLKKRKSLHGKSYVRDPYKKRLFNRGSSYSISGRPQAKWRKKQLHGRKRIENSQSCQANNCPEFGSATFNYYDYYQCNPYYKELLRVLNQSVPLHPGGRVPSQASYLTHYYNTINAMYFMRYGQMFSSGDGCFMPTMSPAQPYHYQSPVQNKESKDLKQSPSLNRKQSMCPNWGLMAVSLLLLPCLPITILLGACYLFCCGDGSMAIGHKGCKVRVGVKKKKHDRKENLESKTKKTKAKTQKAQKKRLGRTASKSVWVKKKAKSKEHQKAKRPKISK